MKWHILKRKCNYNKMNLVDQTKLQIEYLRGKGIDITPWDDSITDPTEIKNEITKRYNEYTIKNKIKNLENRIIGVKNHIKYYQSMGIDLKDWDDSITDPYEIDSEIDKFNKIQPTLVEYVKLQIKYLHGKGIEVEPWDDSITDPDEVNKEIERRQNSYIAT
jgi:hypothetical protein